MLGHISPVQQSAAGPHLLSHQYEPRTRTVDYHQPIAFRTFVVWPAARKLLCSGKPVELGSRAFDLLLALLRSRGDVVTKAEIVRQVWPTTTVEESNLRFQMATLRKALGQHGEIIKTIPGRGYLLAEDTVVALDLMRPDARAIGIGGNGGQPPERPDGGAPADKQEVAAIGKATVALIDPDPEIREGVRRLLESKDLRVRPFVSVEDFLDSEGALDVDCVILEVWFPGKSGLDLQDHLSKVGANIPLIFLSANADVHTAVRAVKAGASDFLTKPVRNLELLDAIRLAVVASVQQD